MRGLAGRLAGWRAGAWVGGCTDAVVVFRNATTAATAALALQVTKYCTHHCKQPLIVLH